MYWCMVGVGFCLWVDFLFGVCVEVVCGLGFGFWFCVCWRVLFRIVGLGWFGLVIVVRLGFVVGGGVSGWVWAFGCGSWVLGG